MIYLLQHIVVWSNFFQFCVPYYRIWKKRIPIHFSSEVYTCVSWRWIVVLRWTGHINHLSVTITRTNLFLIVHARRGVIHTRRNRLRLKIVWAKLKLRVTHDFCIAQIKNSRDRRKSSRYRQFRVEKFESTMFDCAMWEACAPPPQPPSSVRLTLSDVATTVWDLTCTAASRRRVKYTYVQQWYRNNVIINYLVRSENRLRTNSEKHTGGNSKTLFSKCHCGEINYTVGHDVSGCARWENLTKKWKIS